MDDHRTTFIPLIGTLIRHGRGHELQLVFRCQRRGNSVGVIQIADRLLFRLVDVHVEPVPREAVKAAGDHVCLGLVLANNARLSIFN